MEWARLDETKKNRLVFRQTIIDRRKSNERYRWTIGQIHLISF